MLCKEECSLFKSTASFKFIVFLLNIYKIQIQEQQSINQARALMLSSAYSNMVHARMNISPSNSNANMIVSPSVSNASMNVSPPFCNTSIAKATIPNAYSNTPQNFKGTRFLFC